MILSLVIQQILTGGGVSYHEGCDTIGYKGYIGINGGKRGLRLRVEK
jgi:hypothetical protein